MDTEHEGTALDRYASIIKHRVSPAMRALGCTGSGGRYALPSETHWALIGFQKSAFNSASEVRFTINLLVVGRASWHDLRQQRPSLPERPLASGGYRGPVHSVRIGHLIGDGHDTWWSITAATDATAVVDEVLTTLTEVGLLWLRDQLERVEP